MVDETPDLLCKSIYHYIQVDKSSFSIGVAVSSSYKNSLKLSPDSTQGDELYHRISKQPSIQNSLCNHQGYIATKGLYIGLIAMKVCVKLAALSAEWPGRRKTYGPGETRTHDHTFRGHLLYH